jgi:hypothetical protein
VAAAAATTPEPDWPQAERAITYGLAGAWPGASAGPLLGWRVGPGEGGTSLLEVWHLGSPLGTAGEGLLERLLGRQLRAELRIRAHAVAPRLQGAASPSPSFLLPALEVIDQVSRVAAAHVCLTTPSVVKGNEDRRRRRGPRPAAQVTELQAAFLAALDRIPAHRRHQFPGSVWQLDVQQGPCIAPGASDDRLSPQRRP